MYCAHCRKLITENNHKFLDDLLSTSWSGDINTGHVQSALEVTVLDALARVVGVRLLAKDKLKLLSEELCICESCEQLLQKLYAAHECFWDDNSLIVKSFDWHPVSNARIEKSTQTDFDLTEDTIAQSSSGEDVRIPDSISNDDFEDDMLDNQGSETEGHPEPVHNSSDTFSILKTLGILNDVTRFPFVKIESSVRRLADLKMKSGSHRPTCDREHAINTAVSNENIEFFNHWYESMSLSNAVISTPESEKLMTPTTIKLETDIEEQAGENQESTTLPSTKPPLRDSEIVEETRTAAIKYVEDSLRRRTLRRKCTINYNEIGEENGLTEVEVLAGVDPQDEDYFPAVEDGKPEEENYAEGEDLHTDTPSKKESSSTRLKSNSKAANATGKEFRCKFPECAKRMFAFQGLSTHETVVHGKPKMDAKEKYRQRKERSRHCKFDGCGKSFPSEYMLKSHYAETHVPVEERQSFPCEECGKSFSRPHQLLRHRNIHLPPPLKQVFPPKPKNFKCDEPGCTKAYENRRELLNHKIRHTPMHSRKRLYPCQICEKRFFTPDIKKKHMKVHSEARNYLCTECGKAFKDMQRLGTHMKGHTGEYKCKECGKTFQCSWGLKNHAAVHTGERSEICEICGRGFKTLINLTYHMAQHDNKRQHKCPAPSCTADFNYKHHLRQHLEGVHSLDPQKVNRFLKNPESEKLFD